MLIPRKWTLWLATGFGLGYAPVASGTFGSLPGIAIVALYAWAGLSPAWQIAISLIAVVLAVPICDAAEEHFGGKDDGRIVADEYLTFPLAMLGLPWLDAAHWWVLPMAFVVTRLMDILKPWPARQIQALRGGYGIVADDVFASLYALALNHLLLRGVERWLAH